MAEISSEDEIGEFTIKVSTGKVEVSREGVKHVTTLADLYYGDAKPVMNSIKTAVENGSSGKRDNVEVRNMRPKSFQIILKCFTNERFLVALEDCESGKLEKRLQEEFSKAGIKVNELKVEIENVEEVNKTRETIHKRYVVLKPNI
jgi:hypothetical protein